MLFRGNNQLYSEPVSNLPAIILSLASTLLTKQQVMHAIHQTTKPISDFRRDKQREKGKKDAMSHRENSSKVPFNQPQKVFMRS
jgi:hypothetical protein